MKKALIQNGNIVQISAAIFPVHSSLAWVDVADHVEAGYGWDGTKPVPPILVDNSAELALDIVRATAVEKLLEIEGRKGAGDAAVKDYITKRDQKRTPK